jgi:hypothetical protein
MRNMLAVQCVAFMNDSVPLREAVVVQMVPEPQSIPKDMVLVETLACGVDFVQVPSRLDKD